MTIDINPYIMEDDVEETEVFGYSDLTLDERVGILTWYFTNRTINRKAYEWLINETIDQEAIEDMTSIALIDFVNEWNEEVRLVSEIKSKEPHLNVQLYLIISKSSSCTYSLSREYQEGGITTVEDKLELYDNSKALNDILDVYASMSVFTRNGDYIWKQ